MAAVYEVRIKSRTGVLREVVTGALGDPDAGQNDGYVQLSYVKEVNGVGNGVLVLNAESAVAETLAPSGVPELDMQVEFWRSDTENDIAPYCDFYGFLRGRDYETDDNGQVKFIADLEEQNGLLRREIVAWEHNTANRSLFDGVKASTVMTNLVRYNVTSDATTGNGRLYTTDLANITYETDDDDGDVVTIDCALRNLLEVLQEVGGIGVGRDFWLEKTGAQAWEFRTDNLRGVDRSTTVQFSSLFGNMRRAALRSNHRAEKTRALIGGGGQRRHAHLSHTHRGQLQRHLQFDGDFCQRHTIWQ